MESEKTYMGYKLDLGSLLSKDDILKRLRLEGASYKTISEILTYYEDIYGSELQWHYPVSDSIHSGGFLVPVKEGMLYIPYDEVNAADEYEVLLPDKASLMDDESCEIFINELTSFVDGLCKALREAMAIFNEPTSKPDK